MEQPVSVLVNTRFYYHYANTFINQTKEDLQIVYSILHMIDIRQISFLLIHFYFILIHLIWVSNLSTKVSYTFADSIKSVCVCVYV